LLQHHLETPQNPNRVVVVGANSFVGNAILKRLTQDDIQTCPLGRLEVDLARENAGTVLASYLQPGDSVVAVAAKAPCRNPEDFLSNARIIRTLHQAFERVPVAHLVNISSDAVYPDEPVPLTETVPAAPSSLHGAMHLAREIALQSLGLPLASLRPTLIYGAADPHSGYGPNLFRRKANNAEPIELFGEGEERRDHVSIDDVAELAVRALRHRSTGILNVASGTVSSFRQIAELVIGLSGRSVAIVTKPRRGPMPHNGYRPFDISATIEAFPDFQYTDLKSGLEKAQEQEFSRGPA